jgi:molybdopterin converting factor small subunit
LREIAGGAQLEVDVEDTATPESVFEALAHKHPRLAEMKSRLRCAVDQEYAEWSTPLREGVELAFIPPTAGG